METILTLIGIIIGSIIGGAILFFLLILLFDIVLSIFHSENFLDF